ncbi:MAG TPA: O-antigen ligase family protein [Chloroflexota bacterium]|nr:O-antigen ligase family protein [Chloroflexota bacterium]
MLSTSAFVSLVLGFALVRFFWPRVAATIYVLAIPAFPFYWTPFSVVALNDVSVLQMLATGLAVGMTLESWRDMMHKTLDVPRIAVEAAVFSMIVIWSLSSFDVATTTGVIRSTFFGLLDYWVPFVLALRLARDLRAVREVLWLIAVPAVVVAALAAYEYASQTPIVYAFFADLNSSTGTLQWNPALRAGLLRVQVSFGQATFLAFYLISAGLLLVVLGNTATTRFRRLTAYFSSILVFLVSLLPLVRGAIVGLLVCLAVLVVIAGGRLRRTLFALMAVGLIAIWLTAGFLDRTNSFLADFVLTVIGQAPISVQAQQLENINSRIDLVQVGSDLISRSPPLGYGDLSIYGTNPIQDTANTYLEVGLISGPIGLGLFLLLLTVAAVNLARVRLSEDNPSRVALLNGIIVCYVLTIMCWFDSSWPGQLVQVQFIVLGLAIGWRRMNAGTVVSEVNSKSSQGFIGRVDPAAARRARAVS